MINASNTDSTKATTAHTSTTVLTTTPDICFAIDSFDFDMKTITANTNTKTRQIECNVINQTYGDL
jgi:hypothetical protein